VAAVTALGYGTTGLSIGQRCSTTDWYRDGTLHVAVETHRAAAGDVD
jgi:hypothetical protein